MNNTKLLNNHTNLNHRQQPGKNNQLNPLERLFIWLSGSDKELLKSDCPKWEKIKYEAFGASVLVPVCFGMIAASYAVSTLTDNWYIIGGFALIWGFIILAIDRVLLSTYRAYASKRKKSLQFFLRITVAVLMGLTISHPLTLLLFQDTIASEIEKKRASEITAIKQVGENEVAKIEQRIAVVRTEIDNEQQRLEDIISGRFLEEKAQTETQQQVATEKQPEAPASATKATPEQELDRQISDYKDERDQLRRDLERWQETYDSEVRGIRSGVAGVGPNARAIERDHLVWRKEELKRLNGLLSELNAQRTTLTAVDMKRKAEAEALIEARRQKLEIQKLDTFADQQAPLIEMVKARIEAGTTKVANLEEEISVVASEVKVSVQAIKEEPRDDLMSQTLALHDLFIKPHEGGTFALMVYLVLAALFAMIDTIPLVVKFFAEPGPYDMLVHYRDHCLLPLGKEQDVDFLSRMKFRADMSHELVNYEPEPVEPSTSTPFLNQPPIAANLTEPV